MTQRGLLPEGAGAPQVYSYPQTSMGPWSVSWTLGIGSYPVDGPSSRAVMGIGAQGAVTSIMESPVRVAGGSSYPLIPWRQAWTQVAAGRWYRESGAFTGGNGPSGMEVFDATSVHLGYAVVDGATERDFLVPMWVFTDKQGMAELFYPAVAPSALTYTWAPKPWPSPQR
jgi:hypothetical protein